MKKLIFFILTTTSLSGACVDERKFLALMLEEYTRVMNLSDDISLRHQNSETVTTAESYLYYYYLGMRCGLDNASNYFEESVLY